MGRHKGKTDTPNMRTCVLCGNTYPTDDHEWIIGLTGQAVCSDCLGISRRILPDNTGKEETAVSGDVLSPRGIIRRLDTLIIGQKKAKEAVAIALWKQLLRMKGDDSVPRSNLLLYGPTGCGKTALVREAAKITGLPFLAFDATSLSGTGYRGRDAGDIIADLAEKYEDHEKLEYSVVFIDESDKLAARGNGNHAVYNQSTQHTLLKIIEGTEVPHNGNIISTDDMLFIFGGAFTGLVKEKKRTIGFLAGEADGEEADISISDFVAYGMEVELMGRIGQYVEVGQLTEEELRRILLESELSSFLQYQKFFQKKGVRLTLSEEMAEELISGAMACGTGARGLNALIEEAMQPLLVKLAEGTLQKKAELRCRYAG